MTKSWWTYLLCFLLSVQLFGQTGSLVTSANKVEIGDHIQMSVRFTFNADINPKEIIFPQLKADQSLNDTIDIISVDEAKFENTTDNMGNPLLVWQQNFVIGIYAGGKVQVGPFEAYYKDDTLETNVTTIQVSVPELQKDTGFVGIKDIETDPYTFWEKVLLWIKEHWIALLVVGIIIIGSIVLAIFMRRKPEDQNSKEPAIPLPIQWLNQLEEIERQQLWQNGKHKEYYIEVTGVIRKFIEYKYNIQALEQTSHEIIDALRLSSIPGTMMTRIQNLFSISDLIKFAKSLPTPQENQEAMNIAKSILAAEIEELDLKTDNK